MTSLLVILIADCQGAKVNLTTEAASSLTKIFMRFRKHGKLSLGTGVPQDSPQAQIVNWLNGRYSDFVHNLIGLLGSEKANLQVHCFSASSVLIVVGFSHTVSSTSQG